jgi:quercetin dioxygenase-like cupin family protein
MRAGAFDILVARQWSPARRPFIREHEDNSMDIVTRRRLVLALGAALFAAPALVVACGGGSNAVDPGVANDPNIVFGPAPSVFPPGAQMAVIQGDPSKAQAEFTVRLRLPDGYVIPPHTHPTDENVTVIDGTFKVGMGTTFTETGMLVLPRGGFVTAPALHAHFAKAQGVTTVQVHAIGPFALTYVNPADLPK